MIYKGSCHCGNIAFEVEGDLKQVIECNCSICSKKGALLWMLPRESLHLLSPEENLGTYTFNKHKVKHRFCPKCGIHPFGEAIDPSGNNRVAINVRCLDGVDLSALTIKPFDGRSL